MIATGNRRYALDRARSAALDAAHLIDRLERLARAGELTGDLNPAQWDALRYLARANRFSRTPGSVADYLAAKRGTVSRTLASLEAKGYLRRQPSARDGRTVDLALTERALRALRRDPLLAMARLIEAACGDGGGALRDALRATLSTAIARNGGRAFGVCSACRHFRPDIHPGAAAPHRCALLDQALSRADGQAICVEQEPRAA